jgi:hypothetical protein
MGRVRNGGVGWGGDVVVLVGGGWLGALGSLGV